MVGLSAKNKNPHVNKYVCSIVVSCKYDLSIKKEKKIETYNSSARVLFSNKCLSQVIQLSRISPAIMVNLQLFCSISSYLICYLIWVNLELSWYILAFLGLFLTISAFQCLYLPILVSLRLSQVILGKSVFFAVPAPRDRLRFQRQLWTKQFVSAIF